MRLTATLRLGRVVLALVGVFLPPACTLLACAWALDDDVSRATLRDIQAIRLVAEVEQPDLKEAWLMTRQFREDLEHQLQQAGVVTAPDAPDRLLVELWIDRPKDAVTLYVYTIAVQFFRGAAAKVGETAAVPHWSISEVDFASGPTLPKIRAHLTDLLNRFIKAFHEQNPKR